MPARILSAEPSVFNTFLAELRDAAVQQDRQRFRLNMRRCGTVLAYELSRQLPYARQEIRTPLGTLETDLPDHAPVLAGILRAALPLLDGFLDVFDQADTAFVSAFRKHHRGSDAFDIQIEYLAAPPFEGRSLVVIDPMIATGRSMVQSCEALFARGGQPAQLFVCGLIASEEGLDYLERHLPDAQLLLGAVDSELTSRGYIVPGLGDAGDLAFGPKD